MKLKKLLAALIAVCMAFALFAFAGCKDEPDTQDPDDKTDNTDDGTGDNTGDNTGDGSEDETGDNTVDTSVKLTGTIYLVGDSTACDYEKTQGKLDNAYLPRYGFGTQLYNYINCDEDQINNLALSGRSSLSFVKEGYYNTLKDNLSSGDYLIIAFGHNDEKNDDAARFTDPTKDTDDASTTKPSFKYVLNENYIKLAEDKGATPILCTPIVRYDDKGNYTGGKIHNTSDGDYAKAIRDLGAETGTAVIDLTKLTKELYESDNDLAQYYHYYSSYNDVNGEKVPSGIDTTHLNKYGAKVVAYELAQGILKSNCSLKANVITNATAPTFESDYADAIKAGYVKPDYKAPTLNNPIATIGEGDEQLKWYKSAFGNLGGDGKVSNYSITYSDGKFTVGNAGNTNGKFESAGDGIGAAFIQIKADANFTASATVKVTDMGSADAQSGFGMMLRDDMYINVGKDLVVNANFIAAGAINATSGKAIFARNEETLAQEANATTINTTNEYTVSITRNGQSIVATFDDGTNEYTKEYLDVKMNVVDGEYMYLCLFANRGFVVEFTDVQFEITGTAGES